MRLLLRALYIAVLLPIVAVFACQSSPTGGNPVDWNPEPPAVFRSVLDLHPRMITMKLADDFWVSYSAESGALYRVWRDGVDFDGAVYTTAHGPQPTSAGPAWVEQDGQSPWRVIEKGRETAPASSYKGHDLNRGRATLRVALETGTGTVATVEETPEAVRDREGHAGLKRTFATSGLSDGTTVSVEIDLQSMASASSFSTDGTFQIYESTQDAVHGRLTLKPNGTTTFSAFFREPTIGEKTEGAPSSKPEGLALIERNDCLACHNAEVKTVGPSYRSIAEKYSTSDLVVGRLATKVIRGGSGAWGESMMTAHPALDSADVVKMVKWILSLDDESTAGPLAVGSDIYPPTDNTEGEHGLVVSVYPIVSDGVSLDVLKRGDKPFYSGIVPALHFETESDIGAINTLVYLEASGVLNVPEKDNYVLRIVSDDGGRLFLDGKMLIDNDGLHGADPKDAELILEPGPHPIRVTYFQGLGGAALSLQWARSTDDRFTVIPPERFTFDSGDVLESVPFADAMGKGDTRPGDTIALTDVHPSFSIEDIRPSWFHPKVGGLDVFEDGRVAVSVWDPTGAVYLLSNLDQGDPEQVQVKQIASGLAEPLGLKIVDGEIYVMQKQELTHLVDLDGDDVIDRYETVANDWGVTPNFHEFGFGLAYEDGYFYATLATGILPGGASAQPQNPDRGSVLRVNRTTGAVELIARGLRTPNGIGKGVDGELFVADNQGDWLPASKIVHVQEGAFYGSRSVDFTGTAGLAWQRPVVWLPQDEIGNSPSQPTVLNVGPYRNQMIHGEVTHGGLKRVFAELVDGEYQGAVFRFTQGIEAGVNRIAWGPDGKLYIGGVGNPGNWGHAGGLAYGLQRMAYTGDPVFEMLAVRAQADGFEIEFTEPLGAGVGEDVSDYSVDQWYYLPTAQYGGPKMDPEALTVRSVAVSQDRKRATLRIEGLKPDHVVYFRLKDKSFTSDAGRSLWSTEAWYTLNRIPNRPR